MIEKKIEKLLEALKKKERVCVAFSGGVDSTTLAALTYKALGKNALACTIDSEVFPKLELEETKRLARLIGIKHIISNLEKLKDEKFRANPKERCYFCKKGWASKLKEVAREHKISVIADGCNKDDLGDFRPGLKAVREEGIWSPFIEFGISKKEIREIAKALGLSIWGKPQMACLSSRIPYNTEITPDALERIERAEEFLKNLGFRQYRVRDYGELARIEVDDLSKVFKHRVEITKNLRKLGYRHVTLDLEGYVTGSMNR
ncbi:MAG: ATP-dependent sacrificial sulfur transferase LarE [Candidatus Methanofastidiosia archaeon]